MERCVYEVKPDVEDFKKIASWQGKDFLDAKLKTQLAKITEFDFDVFDLRKRSNGNELVITINYLMEINDFYSKLNIDKDKFLAYSIAI